jgi:hypothetical protein
MHHTAEIMYHSIPEDSFDIELYRWHNAVYNILTTGLWFSHDQLDNTPVSHTNKTDSHESGVKHHNHYTKKGGRACYRLWRLSTFQC